MTTIRTLQSPSISGKDPNDERNNTTEYVSALDSKRLEHDQKANTPSKRIEDFVMTDEQIDKLKDTHMLYPGMIAEGHIINFVGTANAGKTSIAMFICKEMARNGTTIWYINADTAPDAAKIYHQSVRELQTFQLILPDIQGHSVDDVVKVINGYIDCATPLENTLIVFDTLKKVVDLMSKRGLRQFYQWARKLTALNATVLLLGHTNKHSDSEGNLIFEGTGDIRNDTDELFYIESIDNPDKSKTVSVTPDKRRALGLEPMTFNISPQWVVSKEHEFVDIAPKVKANHDKKKDAVSIQKILTAINDIRIQGQTPTQSRIIEALKGQINAKPIQRILGKYKGDLWAMDKGIKNAWQIWPLDENGSVLPVNEGKTGSVSPISGGGAFMG